MTLVGTIPPDLGNLSFLSSFTIVNNSFHGTLPNQSANLRRLNHMNLENNEISGEIPSWFGSSFTRLRTLYLFGNNFSGLIPSSLCYLPKLEILSLNRNNLQGQIPVRIGNISTLKILSLETNLLSGPVPSSIGNLTFLSFLDFSCNSLSDTLAFQVGNLQNLEVLYLGHNNFTGFIPPSIFNMSTTRVIWLGFNLLSGQLPPVTGHGLPKLEGLYLELNQLSGPIPSSISNASKLINLQLPKNSFSELFQTLVIFDDNPLISGELLVSVENLSASVSFFYASHCSIKGWIPSKIGNLSLLFWLGLDHNVFTGTMPATPGNLRELQNVNLGSNKLHGSILSELCRLQRLAYLTLTDNELSGPIPACLVSSNSLTGSLPVDIGNWKSVTNLNLSDNLFSGAIPSTIAGFMHPTHLSLSGNMLQGSVPQSFDELISLEYLDLSRNNLSGPIPKSLENLQNLKYLNVSFNRLQGGVPNGGSFGNYSSQSFIGNEELCGSPQFQVPPCRTDDPYMRAGSSKLLIYILPAIGSPILISTMIIVLLRCRSRKDKARIQENLLPLAEWRRVSYHELHEATDGFSESNLIGAGSFGSVYQGTLPTGMTIAVKVFNMNQDREPLKASMSSARYSATSVIEIWLKSLVALIWNSKPWLNIMIDIALALEYLHHDHTPPVVHCDLKPNNILLDKSMVAHLGEREQRLAVKDSLSSILQLALQCSADIAEERIDIEEVARLKKIKAMYLRQVEHV
ncbi:putative Leucine-rich repeat protein kinase family protein [Hibiscus syriacus]|uniref:Leucine-rich repeat protein kinase family protein n=1 Tax=Hibiscus syriacus TaxID=106335 RepID=A0A6A2XUJ8_HIBSY|nr:putative Leucine-rich repeat protein kinase family protein [Hibiscus syriacus]